MKEKLKMINWDLRLQNRNFRFRIYITILVTILGYFGMEASDMTTWSGVFKTLGDALSNPYLIGLVIWNILNISVDPTTPGLGDSNAALEKRNLEQQTYLMKGE